MKTYDEIIAEAKTRRLFPRPNASKKYAARGLTNYDVYLWAKATARKRREGK